MLRGGQRSPTIPSGPSKQRPAAAAQQHGDGGPEWFESHGHVLVRRPVNGQGIEEQPC